MTSFLTRFVEHASYQRLFGRAGVLEKIRKIPKGTGKREQVAVEEYCTSLKDVCGFRYASQAVILDPAMNKMRYHLVFATHSPIGINVFKQAEMEAARTQDDVRYQAEVRRTGQEDLFVAVAGEGAPRKGVASHLRADFVAEAQRRVLEILSDPSVGNSISYVSLFCAAMELPLVTPSDLVGLLRTLERNGYVRLDLGPGRRTKPSPDREEDRIVIIDRVALKSDLTQ